MEAKPRSEKAATGPQEGGFGTLGGVFTPCTLTILGVIMFLRFGVVVGQAGILHALLIVLIAKIITTLTGLSLSAIATNTRVKGGGAYYLISLSLGVEFGGAIGVVFFLAQAISVAMYVVGFTEALLATFPTLSEWPRAIASLVNLAVFVCVYIGAGWTIKIQYGILAALALALGSFFVGAWSEASLANFRSGWVSHYEPGESFFTMFALFFPAVTGIMAGANMSGDLRDPARAIPRGTLAAIAVTAVIYVAQALMLGAARPSEELISNNMAIREISTSGVLITLGVFSATLSSALGSMMGAPRILQAFARDGIFGWLSMFGAGSGPQSEPRRATLLTFAIAQSAILMGDLNAIAPIITMAFMITYGTLNLATFYESITGNPSYRPRFRFCHWSTALLGAVGCVAVMFLIAPIFAGVSILAMAMLMSFIRLREIEARWGDVHSGAIFERTRRNLLKLEDELYHPKNWRPMILTLFGGGTTRLYLAVYGHWLTSGQGILTLAQVIQGDIEERLQRRANQEELLHQLIRDHDLQAFPSVIVAQYLNDGIEALVQCHGLGALRPNTVLVGWPSDPSRAEAFGSMLRVIQGMKRSLLAIRHRDEQADEWEVPSGTIDIWWRGMANGALMLLLAYLLTRNAQWRTRRIRLLRVITNDAGREEVLVHLNELIEHARIPAQAEVVVAERVAEAIQHHSRWAAVVFLGFEPPEEGKELALFEGMERLAGPLPITIFVNSAGGMSLE